MFWTFLIKMASGLYSCVCPEKVQISRYIMVNCVVKLTNYTLCRQKDSLDEKSDVEIRLFCH